MKRSVFLALVVALSLTACLQGAPLFRAIPTPATQGAPSAVAVTQAPTAAPQGTALHVSPVAVATAAPPSTTQATAAPPEPDVTVGQSGQTDLAQVLPLDPTVRHGKLDNGLTYYIRQNTEPAGRAELWLVVNAGSVLEDNDQKGLAHFLEHMLFNGTRHFPDGELVKFLESIGMEFGPEINAYTSFDETVYNLEVPSEDEQKVAKAFDVLQDWAGYATLSDKEIDKERGVIVEEWRVSDLNASGPVYVWKKMVPTVLGGSKFADRMPIGDMEVVRNAPPDALRRFYKQWYRPDLMAVIAVGDFDVEKVEGMILERFSTLPAAEQPASRPAFDVPTQPGTRYLVVKDPENPRTTLEILLKQPARRVTTAGEYRDLIADYLINGMLNQRYAEIARQTDAPFLGAGVSRDNFVRPMAIYSIYAAVKDDGILRGLDAALTEFERARRHGFTGTELQRAKDELLRFFESAYADPASRQSAERGLRAGIRQVLPAAGCHPRHRVRVRTGAGAAAWYHLG